MQATHKEIIVVLTVGTQSQKQLCKKLISQNESVNFRVEVICDDDFGQRIGSGGAILNAIGRFYGECQKLIVINCGGFSKRTVSCAVKGKAFAQIVNKKRVETLFQYILENSLLLASGFEKGALVACSDILIDASSLEVDLSQSTGFGICCDLETGTQHGVMVKNEKEKLVRFLHKTDAETLKKSAADKNGQVTVDTGLVYLDDGLVNALIDIIKTHRVPNLVKSGSVEMNFYSDVMPLLGQVIDVEKYLDEDTQNQTHRLIKEILYKKLSRFSLNVCQIGNQEFMHFGTNRQLIANTFSLAEKADGFLKINSFVDENVKIGNSTVLDNACLPIGSQIGSCCLVSDISFNRSVHVEDNSVVCGFKLTDGSFVSVVTSVDENPKAVVGGVEIWNIPRFYKAKSFDESFDKFRRNADEERYSLQYCAENADVNFYVLNKRYLEGLTQSTPHGKYLEMRNEITDSFLSKRNAPAQFKPTCDAVEISMPVRVNFSGTWTDAMPYCVEHGGGVINAAVTVNNKLPITVKLEKLSEPVVEFCSDNSTTTFSFDEFIGNDFSDFNLHKSVLRTVGINSPSQLDCGLRLSTNVEIIDKGSGLGTSSILLAACFRAFSKMFNLDYSNDDITEMVFVSEQMMKTGGGWQDQIGGLFPGVKYATSLPGIEQKVKVEAVDLPKGIRTLLEEKAVLMPTGQCHFGRFIVNDIADRYFVGADGVNEAYCSMKELNTALLNAVKSDGCEEFLECINRHMTLLKKLSPEVTNPAIDSVIDTCLQVADAVSICGAGAGGYLLVFLKSNQSVDDFKLFVSQKFPEIESEVLKINLFD